MGKEVARWGLGILGVDFTGCIWQHRNANSLQCRSYCRLQGAGKKGGKPRVIAGSAESQGLGPGAKEDQ